MRMYCRSLVVFLLALEFFVCAQNNPINSISILRYRGTAKQMAAEFAKDEAKRFKKIYENVVEAELGSYPEQMIYLEIRRRYETHIDKETLDEIKTFSKISKVDYDKILLINCFYDMIRRAGCRQAVVWGNKSKDGSLIHSRNLDWQDWGNTLRKNNVLLVRHYSKGNAIATLTWPGMVGCLTGCNDKGIVIGFNQLPGANRKKGEPIFLTLKRILRFASNLKQAQEILKKAEANSKITSCGSIMISSCREKKALVIETYNGKISFRTSGRDAFIVSNNTYYTKANGVSKKNRYSRCSIYKQVAPKVFDAKGLTKVMSHPSVLRSNNLLTAIFCLKENKMYLACGRYGAAKGPYRIITIFK